MIQQFNKIFVYGGGSWGTALANYACSVCVDVTLFTLEETVARDVNDNHLNSKYLGDIPLDSKLRATTALIALPKVDILLLAVPSFAFRESLLKMKSEGLGKDTVILVATKGLTAEPVEFFSDCLSKLLPNRFGFISGPNFAAEVARGLPTSVTISSKAPKLLQLLKHTFSSKNMEVSVTDDIMTQQIAGIAKNIIAIQWGILKSSNAGENACATLLTAALKEISIIAKPFGGRLESILEPAVIGDLILTASPTSRNVKFGMELHQSGYSKHFVKTYRNLPEGIRAAAAIPKLIKFDSTTPILLQTVKLISELLENE